MMEVHVNCLDVFVQVFFSFPGHLLRFYLESCLFLDEHFNRFLDPNQVFQATFSKAGGELGTAQPLLVPFSFFISLEKGNDQILRKLIGLKKKTNTTINV